MKTDVVSSRLHLWIKYLLEKIFQKTKSPSRQNDSKQINDDHKHWASCYQPKSKCTYFDEDDYIFIKMDLVIEKSSNDPEFLVTMTVVAFLTEK